MALARPTTATVLCTALLLSALTIVVHANPAWACSYRQLTIAEALEQAHSDSSAVVIVWRIDDGADIQGQVEVIETLAGDVPERLDVTFDGGASCYPSFPPGAVAGLLVNTSGAHPVVEEASMLDPTSVRGHLDGPLTASDDAAGEPAVVLTGRMPGADLVVLDVHLQTVAVADLSDTPRYVTACDDLVVTLTITGEADGLVQAWTLPDLTPRAERVIPALFDRPRHALGCTGHGVALLASDGPAEFVVDGTGVLYSDALTGNPISVPGFLEGDVGPSGAVLVTSSEDAGSELTVVGLDGQAQLTIDVPEERLYVPALSPDGRTVLAWGQAGTQVTVDTTTGAVLGRLVDETLSWWRDPWVADDRLALTSAEPRAYGQVPSGQVSMHGPDLTVHQVIQVPAPAIATAAGLLVTVDGLAALDDDGQVVARAAPQTALAEQVIGLAPIEPLPPADTQPTASPTPTTAPTPPPIPSPDRGMSATTVTTVLLTSAVAAAGVLLIGDRTRRR